MDSLLKEINEVEKQIKNTPPKKNKKKNKKLLAAGDGSEAASSEFSWRSLVNTTNLSEEQEKDLTTKLHEAEWTKVKGKKKNKKKVQAAVPAKNPKTPEVSQDEKLQTLLYQVDYKDQLSRKKKKEKRKTEWELSSILESFCISEQKPASTEDMMDVSGVSEGSKAIKKKKKKIKDRRTKKGDRMEEEKPKPITKTRQAVLVDENDSIQPVSVGGGRTIVTHKEKQRMRTQFRNKARKQRDRAERRNNKGFEEDKDEEDEKVKVKGPQSKGIFVSCINKGKKGKANKLSVEFKKNEKKMKKVLNNLNKFSVLE